MRGTGGSGTTGRTGTTGTTGTLGEAGLTGEGGAGRPGTGGGGRPDVRFGRLLWAEWTKVVSLRSTVATAAITVVVSIGIATLSAVGQGRQYPLLSAAERAAFDPTRVTLLASVLLTQLSMSVLGTLVVTSEYATGTIRSTLTAAPVRGRLLAAKIVLTALLGLVIGQICAFGAFWSAQAVLAGKHVPHAALDQPGVPRAVLGSGLLIAATGLFGLAMGCVLRATAGAITVLTMVNLLVPLLSGLLPDLLATWWPSTAGWEILRVVPVDGVPSPWAGLGDYAAMVAAVVLAGFVVLRRRDV